MNLFVFESNSNGIPNYTRLSYFLYNYIKKTKVFESNHEEFYTRRLLTPVLRNLTKNS